jgi:hypothetical protein
LVCRAIIGASITPVLATQREHMEAVRVIVEGGAGSEEIDESE